MEKKMSVRLACVLTIKKILEEKVFFNTLKESFAPQDKAFANFLILTALRKKTVIDRLLATLLTKKIPNKNKILEYILLLGSVELLYAKTPDYAVVSEYVSMAKKRTDVFSARMVNAVLRKVATKKAQMQNASALPQNFKQILLKDYTADQIQKIESMLALEPPLDLTAKDNPNIVAQNLNGTLFENGTIRLTAPKTNIESLTGYQSGAWWVQDLAASLVVSLMGDVRTQKVLDLCAAPGGKTAQLLCAGAIVTAVDINPERLETLSKNMSRLKLNQNMRTVCADGLEYLKNTQEDFDIILIDAPCSATGTFRKHPEVLHFKTIDDVQKQLSVQKALLFEAAAHIKKGGAIFYATCSLSKAEGELQIKSFLTEHAHFELVDFSKIKIQKFEAQKLDENIFDKQVLRTLPYYNKQHGGMDGFFAAAVRRNK